MAAKINTDAHVRLYLRIWTFAIMLDNEWNLMKLQTGKF